MTTTFDLILRNQARIDELLEDPAEAPPMIRRMLTLSVAGTAAYGIAIGATSAVLNDSSVTQAALLAIAFVVAFIGTVSICLPSFYFYTQLSGIDASLTVVTAQALRVQATTVVGLLGVLPVYVLAVLSAGLGWVGDPDTVYWFGLILPFFIGIIGLRSLYRGFGRLSAKLPRTHTRRGNYISRMVLCWGAVYASVAPVALYRCLEAFGILG